MSTSLIAFTRGAGLVFPQPLVNDSLPLVMLAEDASGEAEQDIHQKSQSSSTSSSSALRASSASTT